jgi:carboxymethylenebutenolidase
MRPLSLTSLLSAVTLLLSGVPPGEPRPLVSPPTVEIPSGKLRLNAFFWKPDGAGPFPAVSFNHGSGGADAAHTAGLTMTEAAQRLAALFLRRGYAFLYLCRRGHGLSADQAPFMQDVLKAEEAAKGKEGRQRLQDTVLIADHLEDVLAALTFLKSAPGIDPHRIAVAGQSSGGQLTLFAAAHDPTLRAAVAFAPAAGSWEHSPELRRRLLEAVGKAAAPIMLIHAANDYSTAPGRALAGELERLHKPHLLEIYPPVGQTPDDGHNELYLAVPQWEGDVFQFLDEHVRR